MSDNHQKKLKAEEEKMAARDRIQVMIVRTEEDGVYLWRGNEYSKEELEKVAKRLEVKTMIINDVLRRMEENE